MGSKTAMIGLPGREKFFYIFSHYNTMHECGRWRDGQTDRRTSDDSYYHDGNKDI